MKQLFLLIFLSTTVYSKPQQLLDSIRIDKDTKLIGMYPRYDKGKTYKDLNFYVDDLRVLQSLRKELIYGEPGENIMEQYGFSIMVIQGNDYVTQWLVSPKYSTIRVDGVSYKIDMKIIHELAKKFHFEYEVLEEGFDSQEKYNEHLQKLKNESSFIFAYEPDFKNEWTFEIEFPKNDTFPHPKAIDEYLRPKVEKVAAGTDNFSIRYEFDRYNMENRNQYTMTVEGSKEIYNNLKLENLRQKNWKYNRPTATIYKRKI